MTTMLQTTRIPRWGPALSPPAGIPTFQPWPPLPMALYKFITPNGVCGPALSFMAPACTRLAPASARPYF